MLPLSVCYYPSRVSRRTEERPGPRRGHTAARAFEGSPAELARCAANRFRHSAVIGERSTGHVAALTLAPRSWVRKAH
jgi:hypothetical protein